MIRFDDPYSVYDDFYSFKISSCKSEEIVLILPFENRIIQNLMQKVVTTSQFTHSHSSDYGYGLHVQISRIILKTE